MGPLWVRATAQGGHSLVLLHGLVASGDAWGGGYDALAASGRLVVPDLLGFGGSLDLDREDFSLDAHLDALDDVASGLGLDGRSMTVIGHSMGAILALCWAVRRPEVGQVVAFSGPFYDDAPEAIDHITAMGWLERLFVLETAASRASCRWMCTHRHAAANLAVALQPRLPTHIARQGVLHSWPSYIGGLKGIVMGAPWRDALTDLNRRGVEVLLAEGACDPVPVSGRAAALAQAHDCVRYMVHPGAGHDLPLSHPVWCRQRILDQVRRSLTDQVN